MSSWIASGRLIDAILMLTLVEWVGLTLYHVRTGHGPGPRTLFSILLPGVFLLLALRASLVAAAWTWIAASLTAALLAHLADLARRWDR